MLGVRVTFRKGRSIVRANERAIIDRRRARFLNEITLIINVGPRDPEDSAVEVALLSIAR